jgi:ribosome-binding protein aMBF1 (putative translation factor)
MKMNELRKKLEKNPEFRDSVKELELHFKLANAVLKARIKKGWSQIELAEVVGTKQANISRIEAGLANPTITLVNKLVKALDLEINFASIENIRTLHFLEENFSTQQSDNPIRVIDWPVPGCSPNFQIGSSSIVGGKEMMK